MKNKKEIIKLPIHFDLVNEIIYKSTLIILFGIAYLFALNLLRFNWYSVLFGFLLLLLIYLKRSSHLKMDNNSLTLFYFKFYQAVKIEVDQIDECIFYSGSSLVEVLTKENNKIRFHLKDKNKKMFLDWLIKYCPSISPIYIKETKKDS